LVFGLSSPALLALTGAILRSSKTKGKIGENRQASKRGQAPDKSSKFQTPTARETSSFNKQTIASATQYHPFAEQARF
jgi:hypothetical protein